MNFDNVAVMSIAPDGFHGFTWLPSGQRTLPGKVVECVNAACWSPQIDVVILVRRGADGFHEPLRRALSFVLENMEQVPLAPTYSFNPAGAAPF